MVDVIIITEQSVIVCLNSGRTGTAMRRGTSSVMVTLISPTLPGMGLNMAIQ